MTHLDRRIREQQSRAADEAYEMHIMDCLAQLGISTPRSQLTDAQIRAAIARFDPARRVWPEHHHIRPRVLYVRPACPHCGNAETVANGRCRLARKWLCRGCERYFTEGK